MKFMTRLTIGAAMAGAMFGLAGTASAATTTSAAAPAASDDVHVNYVNGFYAQRNVCEASRAITAIWHRTEGCYSHPGSGWYYYWW